MRHITKKQQLNIKFYFPLRWYLYCLDFHVPLSPVWRRSNKPGVILVLWFHKWISSVRARLGGHREGDGLDSTTRRRRTTEKLSMSGRTGGHFGEVALFLRLYGSDGTRGSLDLSICLSLNPAVHSSEAFSVQAASPPLFPLCPPKPSSWHLLAQF